MEPSGPAAYRNQEGFNEALSRFFAVMLDHSAENENLSIPKKELYDVVLKQVLPEARENKRRKSENGGHPDRGSLKTAELRLPEGRSEPNDTQKVSEGGAGCGRRGTKLCVKRRERGQRGQQGLVCPSRRSIWGADGLPARRADAPGFTAQATTRWTGASRHTRQSQGHILQHTGRGHKDLFRDLDLCYHLFDISRPAGSVPFNITLI